MSKALNFYGRFLIPFTQIGYRLRGLPSRPHFDALKGKKILITGATDGIGAAIAQLACESGASVHVVGRSEDKLKAMRAAAANLPGSIRPWRADLALASDTLALIDGLVEEGVVLDALVNNVGVLDHAFSATKEGIDRMYAINILCPYILAETLFTEGRFASDATILNMASGGLYNAPQNLNFMEQGAEGFNGFAAYATHKRAQIVLSDAWTRERAPARAYTLHPGWVDTPGVQRSLPVFRKNLRRILRTPEQGADTALWLLAQRPDPVEGALWFDRKPRSAHAYQRTRTPLASAESVRAKLADDAGRLKTESAHAAAAAGLRAVGEG